ncbi:MAG TPA: alkaline phosphatase family protein [Thermoanaerobaculia bacterium]|nr:alkaline phosphatase family protein [Thermoanaerobaculia bacterium]
MKRRRLGLTAVSLAFLAVVCSRASGGSSESPRVLLIGIDGADPKILSELIAQGRLPTFARLEREGASGTLRSQEPLLSPIVWTSIATGRRPEDHGVLDFIEFGPNDQPTPITSLRRRVPALWNIATQFRKSSGFVGWYASFPAERVDGFEVSDRLAFHQVRSARAERGATYPEELAAELRSRFGEPRPDLEATRRRFVEGSAALGPDEEKRLIELARIQATSDFYRRIVPDLARRYRPELLGVYFELVDACGHLFMEDAPPRRAGVTDADFTAFHDTVGRCYQYQDEILADLLALEGPNTVTIVVSDHGFKTGAARPETSGRADTGLAPLWHRLHGVVFLHGRPVEAGAKIAGAGIYDVAPTVLSLLGIPLSEKLPGKPMLQALRPGFRPSPIAALADYAPLPARAAPAALPGDPEAVQKLMALGYLSGSGKRAHDASGRTATSFLNEGMARSQSGDIDGALRALGKAVELDPKNVNALTTAASLYFRRKQLDRGKELLDRAARIEPDNFWIHVQMASWDLQSGRLQDARRELDAARRLDDRLPSLYLVRARVERAEGQPEKSLADLVRAEELTDLDDVLVEILALRGQIEMDSGRLDEAGRSFERAAAIGQPEKLAAVRGDLAFARRQGSEAAAFYRQAIAADAGSSTLERKLGEALGASGQDAESEAAFRRAIGKARTDEEKESAYGDLSILFQQQKKENRVEETLREGLGAVPKSGALWGMLGAYYGRRDELEEAIDAYERSVKLSPTALATKTLAALLFEVRKDRGRAVELWKQSLSLDPDQPDVQEFLRRYGSRQKS